MITYGTNYFPSFSKACMYYSGINEHLPLGEIIDMVNEKVAEKAVIIGQPSVEDDEELVLLDEGTRYGIRIPEPERITLR